MSSTLSDCLMNVQCEMNGLLETCESKNTRVSIAWQLGWLPTKEASTAEGQQKKGYSENKKKIFVINEV